MIFTRTRFNYPVQGEWRPIIVEGRQSAWVCCPRCHHVMTLEEHSVADTGEVTPSLVCPAVIEGEEGRPTCGFHDYGLLNGWPEYLASTSTTN